MKRLLLFSLALLGCGGNVSPETAQAPASSTIALTSDDRTLWVVNPDADSISAIDVASRALVAEVPLGPTPAVDPSTMRFDPQVKPRALAILPGDQKIYVAGQTANQVFVVDAQTHTVTTTIPVGAEPVGVVAAPDGKAVYVVSMMAAQVAKIDPTTDTVVATQSLGEPGQLQLWGASLSPDGLRLYVTQFLLHPGLTTLNTADFTVAQTLELAPQPPDTMNGKLVPNGLARGVYTAVPRPAAPQDPTEVWLPHLLLATQTHEPDLDFQSTVFPTVSTVLTDGSAEGPRLLFLPPTVPGVTGAFTDVVSGPRALAFAPDGKLALLVDAQSEDVLVLDGPGRFEVGLVRPLPSTFPEGIVIDHAGKKAYVQGRNSHDVTVLAIDETDPAAPVRVDGDPIGSLSTDPMPAQMRLGQRLFYSANSSAFPLTRNFWVACSSCHLEARTDAVTWLFLQGPRDTPSNGGGPINTGFLLRQALRASVVDYDTTINVEQGGTYHRTDGLQRPQLDAIAAFVNYAIPFPQNPFRPSDGTPTAAQQRGSVLFSQLCTKCHTGNFLTDSGAGNPTLDLSGPILLHDIGTCVQAGPFPDQPAPDEEIGKMHTACDFDTPTLRGIFATPPYFHDGSSPTLRDAVERVLASPNVLPAGQPALSDDDKAALVELLKTL
jgi:YVTN family beta-propeller protein